MGSLEMLDPEIASGLAPSPRRATLDLVEKCGEKDALLDIQKSHDHGVQRNAAQDYLSTGQSQSVVTVNMLWRSSSALSIPPSFKSRMAILLRMSDSDECNAKAGAAYAKLQHSHGLSALCTRV